MVLSLFFYFEDQEIIQTQSRKPKNIKRKRHNKVTKLKFSLILGQLNRALNNPPTSFAFRLGQIYLLSAYFLK